MEIKDRKAIQKASLFHGIEDEECEALVNCLSPHIVHFGKNEIIILTGDFVGRIGIILFGTACAYVEHIDGSQTLMSNLAPMSIFGEILVSTKTHKSPVTIYATSDVTAAFIEYHNVYSMCATSCASHRLFIQNMLKAIGDKYFRLFDRINILREKTLRARILAYLYTQSGRGETTVVTIPYTKTLLADYLLANRSALSRELRRMEHDGVISVKGRKIEVRKNE